MSNHSELGLIDYQVARKPIVKFHRTIQQDQTKECMSGSARFQI